jgi:hypothetical protein
MKSYARSFAFLSLVFAVACSKGPKTFIPGAVDTFNVDSEDHYQQANKILQADYVFALDTSYSMSTPYGNSKKEKLLESMSDFAQSLVSENIKYRIGMIRGNVHAASYSSISTSFIGGIVIDSSQSLSLQNSLFDQLYNLGKPLQENTNLLLESTLKTMQAQSNGFVRPGSQLVYIFVSDVDDLSQNRLGGSRAPSNYASSLKAFKSDSAFVSSRSIVVTGDAGCTADLNYNEKVGTRLIQTSQLLDAAHQANNSINVKACVKTANFAALLDDLAQDVSKPTDRFELQGSSIDNSTIRVFVENQEKTKGVHWNLSGRTVIFTAGNIPDLSDEVLISYLPKFQLSVAPNLDNLIVTINDTQVPQSSSAGWSYNAGENRLVFNGVNVPNGAVVKVAYTGN